MNRYLLLILLSSWAHVVPLSLQCETGVAYPNHLLSVPRSLMYNADVAVLKTYQADTLDKCITDCCAEKYGACTVASFKKNATDGNCQHFNCRPVKKCIYLSSNSTDSFSFTSSSSPDILVPSRNASTNKSSTSTTVSTTTLSTITTNKSRLDKLSHIELGVTKEAFATEEELAFKDDNTTIKPRKGVEDVTENSQESVSRSGVKPRKGVNLDGVTNSDNSKSRVKPRKGVGPYQSHSVSSSEVSTQPTVYKASSYSIASEHFSESSVTNKFKDVADDLFSDLEKVFEDDTKVKDVEPSSTSPAEYTVSVVHTASTDTHHFIPTTVTTVHSTSSVVETTSSVLQSSIATNYVVSSAAVQTPGMAATSSLATEEAATHAAAPSSSSPTIFEHSKLLFHEIHVTKSKASSETESSPESESERKYKSSMHLVLSLVFGLLVLFSVLGVVAKRVYDGWMRRHYRRMDFLIDGMYNGYG